MKKIFALLAFLALPLAGQMTIQNASFQDVTLSTEGGAGSLSCGTGGVVNETFDDGTDYDDANWTEATSGTGSVDPNDTTRTETWFSSEDFFSTATGTGSTAYSYNAFASTDPFYGAVSVYVDAINGLSDDENQFVMKAETGTGDEFLCVLIRGTATDEEFVLVYGDDCDGTGGTDADTYDFAQDTVYVVQLYYNENGATDDFGWEIWDCGSDGSSCSSDHTFTDAQAVSANTALRFWIGQWSPGSYSDIYFGFVDIDTSEICTD